MRLGKTTHKVNKLQMRLSYCRIYFNTVCNMKNTNNLTQIKLLQAKIGFRIHTKEAPLGGVLISRIPVIFWPNIPYPINSVTNIPKLKYRPFFIGGGSWIMDHNYSLFFAFFSKLFIIHFIFSRDIHYSFFSFCINFPFRNFLQCNSIHWFSKVYISVYTKPYL